LSKTGSNSFASSPRGQHFRSSGSNRSAGRQGVDPKHGHDIFCSITRRCYRESACSIIVCNVTNEDSFDKVEDWICNFSYPDWLFALFGNLSTSKPSEQSPLTSHQAILFFETSAAAGQNVAPAFNDCDAAIYTRSAGVQMGKKKTAISHNPQTSDGDGHAD
jgi:hypothetical protein